MRAGVGAGSKFGRRPRLHWLGQVASRSQRRNRDPYERSAPPLSSRYLRVSMDQRYRHCQITDGADAEAAAWLRRSIEANPNQSMSYFLLAATLARLGDMNEARAAVQAGLVRNTGFTIRRFRANPLSDNPTYLAWRERMYEAHAFGGGAGGVMSAYGSKLTRLGRALPAQRGHSASGSCRLAALSCLKLPARRFCFTWAPGTEIRTHEGMDRMPTCHCAGRLVG